MYPADGTMEPKNLDSFNILNINVQNQRYLVKKKAYWIKKLTEVNVYYVTISILWAYDK